jgi:pimeloyl-ACP methyl ester carboxylesterase
VHLPVPDDFFDRIVVESLKLPARLWSVMIESLLGYDDADLLAEITAPTLLHWGDHDALFSRADQHTFLALRPGTELKIYEETGHCPNWERPERVATDILAFVESRGPSAGSSSPASGMSRPAATS